MTKAGARLTLLLMMVAFSLSAQPSSETTEPDGPDTCVACHDLLEEDVGRPVTLFEDDIHARSGFSCVDCHGGDPTSEDMEVSMSPARGFRGKISRRETPELCGECHSDPTIIHKFKPQQRVDQLAQYRTSVHGKRLAAGDENVANCVDCHSVHDIREVRHALSPVHPLNLPETCARCHADSQYMSEYPIGTDQHAEYLRSVHWEALSERGDLSAPHCATCHGNHGATPPGIDSVSNVCGTCHVVFQNLFDESPHQAVFEVMGLAACVVCHGNHEVKPATTEMLGVTEGAVCVDCHSEGENAYEVAAQMRTQIDQLEQTLAEAESVLDQAEHSGMEVSDGRIEWTSAQEQWIKARVQVHSFRLEPVEQAVAEGLQIAKNSKQTGEQALEEMNFRRKGLALSLVTIALVIAGLWLAVRRLEENEGRSQLE